MIKILGREYKISYVVFPVIFLISLVIIFMNILYLIKFDKTVFNMNMGIGLVLFAYSVYNLFLKDK